MMPRSMPAKRSQTADVALRCAQVLDEKKASDILILDLRKRCNFTAFFVIATGRNPRHLHAMGDALRQSLRSEGLRPFGVEGVGSARWVLGDLGSVVVHVFQEEARRFYSLETLWGDAPRVEWTPAPVLPAAPAESAPPPASMDPPALPVV